MPGFRRSPVLVVYAFMCGCSSMWSMSTARACAGLPPGRATRLYIGNVACYLESSMSWRNEVKYGECAEVISDCQAKGRFRWEENEALSWVGVGALKYVNECRRRRD